MQSTDGGRVSTAAGSLAGWPVELLPGHRSLIDYWDALRGTQTYPSRSDVDPTAIRQLLPYTLLLDADPDEGKARFRLAGEAVNTFYGFNVRGMTWAEVRARVQAEGGTFTTSLVNLQYRRVAQGGVGAYRQGVSIRAGASYLHYARILLPLSDDDARVDAMIGVSYSNQEKRNVAEALTNIDFLFSTDTFALVDVAS